MAKIYSLLLVILLFSLSLQVQAQNVGIGTTTPRQKLEVAGAILIGNTSIDWAGSIRYTGANVFEGFDGVSWKPFGGTAGDYWTKVGVSPPTTNGEDVFHTGNVGIGTSIPLAKLHVKGNGAIAIKAETSNSDDAIPAIDAINTIGIAVKATTSSATKPAFYAYSQSGLAIKAESKADTMPAIWVFSDSSIGIRAQTKNKDWYGVEAINKDSAGYALKAVNNKSINRIGGNAALVIGDMNMQGAIRNTDAGKYGGSVAVNDGMTVGTVSGSTCLTTIPTNATFSQTFNYVILYGSGNTPYTYTPTASSGNCRKIYNVYSQVTLYEQAGYFLHTAMKFRSQVVGTIISNADPFINVPAYTVGTLPLVARTVDGIGFQSTWGYNNGFWDGTDPNAVNWVVEFIESSSDGDYLMGVYGRVDYNYGSSSSSPFYAAFGEIRASGTLYANSINAYGDVAEFVNVVPSTRKPEAGDVVSISKNGAQAFALTTLEYDPLLAGVISENPSVLINSPTEGDPVALTGRVKVKVNLKGGAIVPGDPITSSSQEGVGMKANSNGIILGYALETFDGSRAELGKIWILLSKGHVEKTIPNTKIEQVNEPQLGGVIVTGSKKVQDNESVVFVSWDKQLAEEMPADIEFDDLYVELTPFGGKADLLVKSVDSKGFYVSISGKTSDFKGFYYKTDILSTGFSKKESQNVVKTFINYDEKLAYAKNLYSDWQNSFIELQKRSGVNFEKIKSMSFEQASKFKSDAAANWQRNYPDLYRHWQDAGNEVTKMLAADQGLIRQVSGN